MPDRGTAGTRSSPAYAPRQVRVLLDTTFALRGPSGTATYLAQLGPALERLGVEVVAVGDTGRPAPAGGGLGSARNLGRDQRWLHETLPRVAHGHGCDVLHHPLPALAARCPVAQVVTVHDLAFEAFPQHFAPAFRRWARATHRVAARRADAVVAVSRTTAAELELRWKVPPHRVEVARHGPGPSALERLPRAAAPRCFLYVGDLEPRKQLGLLLEAYARYRRALADVPPLDLVLVGSGAPPPAPGVRSVGRASDRELAELQAHAAALVHPSVHEGFGLTVLEAMSAGTPVLAYPSDGVREIGGDVVLYADDALSMADGLAAFHLDPSLRADRSERGRRRAATFSWARSARAHAAAYAAAIERFAHKRG